MGRTLRIRKQSKVLREKLVKSDVDPRIISLLQWMMTRGLDRHSHVFKHLKMAVFPETGRGIVATKDIGCGDVIISVPESLFITRKLILKSSSGPYLRIFNLSQETLSEIDVLTLFLMLEKRRGADSTVYHYLQTLPTRYTTPPYFSQNAIGSLPSHLRTEFDAQMFNFEKKYRSLKPIFCKLFQETFRDLPTESECFELFRWSWCTVNTRCIYVNTTNGSANSRSADSVALIPFLDLLNHSPEAKVKAGFVNWKGTFDIVSQSKIKKYSQVFICYGNHSNRKLLMEYGFVASNNPNDIVPVTPDEIVKIVVQAKEIQINGLIPKDNLNILTDKGFMREGIGCSTEGLTWNTVVSLCGLMSKTRLQSYEDILKKVAKGTETRNFHSIAIELLQRKLKEYNQLMNSTDNNFSSLDDSNAIVKKLLKEETTILQNAILLYL